MRAETFTLLSLLDYAKELGLDPLHFAGGYSTLRPLPNCRDVWYQYDWQDVDLVSRNQLAITIAEAEKDIADALGYWPAPMWLEQEYKGYPRLYRPDLTGYGQDVRYRLRSVRTEYGQLISGGVRNAELIPSPQVAPVYSDPDGDNFDEIATFTINGVSATLDPCEVKMYYKEYLLADEVNTRTDPASVGADPAWEIKPINASVTGTTLTVTCNSWQLFRPQLFEEHSPDPIDADAAASYVDTTMFYRVYNDDSTQVQFGWAPENVDTSLEPDAYATQDGVMRIINKRSGIISISPATYTASTATWAFTDWTYRWEPDIVHLWYYAGDTISSTSCPILPAYWKRIIAMLATARLDWPICGCETANALILSDRWREDLSVISSNKSHIVSAKDLDNPFGTRRGEVDAWKRVAKSRGRMKGQAIIT